MSTYREDRVRYLKSSLEHEQSQYDYLGREIQVLEYNLDRARRQQFALKNGIREMREELDYLEGEEDG